MSLVFAADPLITSLGPGVTTLTHGAPWGIVGPLRHCGAQGRLPPCPPCDGPDLLSWVQLNQQTGSAVICPTHKLFYTPSQKYFL